jgi:type IV pilus assembly protein PilP
MPSHISEQLILRRLQYGLLVCLGVLLAGCGEPDLSDLKEYIHRINQRENPQVDPIPAITLVPPVVYNQSHLRDPFRPISGGEENQNTTAQIVLDPACGTPPDIIYRNRYGLEKMPLDSLLMVGTLAGGTGDLQVILEDTEGLTHLVKIGDFVGQHYGRVEYITQAKVEITELRQDDRGCWREHPTQIVLPDPGGR